MKNARSRVLIGWLIFATSTALNARDDDRRPDTPPLDYGPRQVRVQTEFIEVSTALLDELMFGEQAPPTDGALREEVGRLITRGKATLVETLMAVTESGNKASAESIREFIYPTEFEGPEVPDEVRSDAKPGQPVPKPRDFAVGYTPSAWDTRNLGVTLEIEPRIANDERTVNLRFVPELTYFVRNEIWAEWKDRRGTAHVQMPIFYTLRCNFTVNTLAGKYLMAAALSPRNENGEADPTRKLMVFVKCDILHTMTPDAVAAVPHEVVASDDKSPKLVRSQLEFIEVPHTTYTALMAGTRTLANDDEIRAKAGELIATGDATLRESMLGISPSGRKGTTESIREFVYATEYEPPELPRLIRLKATDPTDAARLPDLATGPTPSAWDTRNLGSTFEFEPTVSDDGRLVAIRFVPEIVDHVGNQVWVEWKGRYGRASIEMPDMYTLRCNTFVTVPVGRYLMVAVLSPRTADGVTDPTRKIMAFLKCEVLSTGK